MITKDCKEALIKNVSICFYYKGEALDSLIMEKLNEFGEFDDGFINTHYDGAEYGFLIKQGALVCLENKKYVVSDVQIQYINECDGIFPIYLKIYLEDGKN